MTDARTITRLGGFGRAHQQPGQLMDLSQVKAAVKAWEKAFKLAHERQPTKQDIKDDPNGIAEQYALYRRLSKQVQVQSQTQPSGSQTRLGSTAPSSTSTYSAGPSRTPRNIPANEYPTTPTPHSRRSSGTTTHGSSSLTHERPRPVKRPAPEPSSSSPKQTQSFVTPKKPRPSYAGPIIDPNPINPFASTPPKRSPFAAHPESQSVPVQSPFLHASSPRKLRELLQSNSLRKVRERLAEPEITPRTKARLRLTGDFVTPAKDRGPRRKRGEGLDLTGKEAMSLEDHTEHDEEDDEFGPSPMKTGPTRTFTELLRTAEEPQKGVRGKMASKAVKASRNKNQSQDILSFFGRAAPKTSIKISEVEDDSSAIPILQPVVVPASPPQVASEPEMEESRGPTLDIVDEQESDDPDRLSTPPPAPLLESTRHLSANSPVSRQPKIVSFSDDEEDEWDPEGGRVQRQVFITNTRRVVRRRGSLSESDDDEDGAPDSDTEQMAAEVDMDQDAMFDDEEETAPTLTFGGTTASSHSSPAPSIAPPMISLLSLRSPVRRGKLDDLRVKAIFNPLDAVRLKAAKKGQDVFVSGEGGESEDEEGVLDQLVFGHAQVEDDDQGDDDWEEECEGWKRTELGLDDEDW